MRTTALAVGVAVTTVALVGAQSPPAPAGPRLTFEVASIKRNVSGDPGAQIRLLPGGQLSVTNNSLFNLIRNAWGTQRTSAISAVRPAVS